MKTATSKNETAIADALERAGLNVVQVRLREIIRDALLKHHNNIDRALPTMRARISGDIEAFDEALRQLAQGVIAASGGHLGLDVQPFDAPAGRSVEGDGGQATRASDSHSKPAASPSPNASGGGHLASATDGQFPPAIPTRFPSPAQTQAVAAAKNISALSVFDRELTRTGQKWGNVSYRELDGLIDDAEIARAVKGHIGSLRGEERHKYIRDLMTPLQFTHLLRKVRGAKHAA